MRAFRKASSKTRDCALDRYNTATSRRAPPRAIFAAGPQGFAETSGVVGDQGVGGLQNRPGGTVILFQLVEHRPGEIAAELIQVLDARAAPAVYGLIVITDDKRHPALRGQQH